MPPPRTKYYRFHTLWGEVIKDENDRRYYEYADVHTFTDKDTAIRAHVSALAGNWVLAYFHKPSVSDLYEVKERGIEDNIRRGGWIGEEEHSEGSGHEYFRQQLARFLGKELP